MFCMEVKACLKFFYCVGKMAQSSGYLRSITQYRSSHRENATHISFKSAALLDRAGVCNVISDDSYTDAR